MDLFFVSLSNLQAIPASTNFVGLAKTRYANVVPPET